jgi:glyoxylase-like metal-dependent hydrolase (beta-lactamase superfamily II)
LEKVFVMRHIKINDTTYAIYDGSVISYLLIGEERAVMIDSGMTGRNIRAYAQKLTDKPLSEVINTHGHFDHVAGNKHFQRAYMSQYAAGEVSRLFMSGVRKKPRYDIEPVGEGSIIDLGYKMLQIISIPAHNAGSIAILDINERTLFTGDEVVEEQILLIPLLPYDKKVAVETQKENMEKLLNMSDYFDYVCPAHHAQGTLDKSIIENILRADKDIMEGAEGHKRIYSKSFFFALPRKTYRKYTYKNASIVYSNDTILIPRDGELINT